MIVDVPKEQWEALLTTVDLSKFTYTDTGINAFNAYQAIQKAVDPSAPQLAGPDPRWLGGREPQPTGPDPGEPAT